MKNILLATFLCIGIAVQAQSKKKFDKPTIVEASCGECKFGMKGESCDLAVRIDGKSYFVDGTTIHDHGDAHSDQGFCNAIRKASVTGEIKGNRFAATSFKLIEDKK
ncbi:DUF6370 family protein [Flavobacterium limi]|uniref:Glutaminyl-tRNA synthetase n=1 Tax=Flavobacterium limi TaxID=2045105 RepID=A0ABQ1TKS6_9FLAO|nr:DUF6370 family protein [Flavobacterium limi]GGE97308.1 hypothetical protein GCM10011518_03280 [Flavobacterium limi]